MKTTKEQARKKFDELLSTFINHYKNEKEQDLDNYKTFRNLTIYFNNTLEKSDYHTIKGEGVEITKGSDNDIVVKLSINESLSYGYFDVIGYLENARKCIAEKNNFDGRAELFISEPGEVIEKTEEIIKEPDDYKDAKAKAKILDGILSRELNISGKINPHQNLS